LASRLLGEKKHYAIGALEQLASDLGVDKSAEGFINAAMSSEKGIEVAIMTYAQKYQEAQSKLTVSQFYNIHKEVLESYLGDKEKEILASKYSEDNTSMEEVQSVISYAQHNLKSPDEKERTDAEKTMEKYQSIAGIMQIIQDEQYKNLLPKAIERTNKRILENLVR
ncbi:hypothetical protein KAR52_03725, partial [Candidatus Pacearchaeota archaeon]|nr:hypothetical protein [Candidatus Pacearchaeota archaeon]